LLSVLLIATIGGNIVLMRLIHGSVVTMPINAVQILSREKRLNRKLSKVPSVSAAETIA
jgi:hypothetical protein